MAIESFSLTLWLFRFSFLSSGPSISDPTWLLSRHVYFSRYSRVEIFHRNPPIHIVDSKGRLASGIRKIHLSTNSRQNCSTPDIMAKNRPLRPYKKTKRRGWDVLRLSDSPDRREERDETSREETKEGTHRGLSKDLIISGFSEELRFLNVQTSGYRNRFLMRY